MLIFTFPEFRKRESVPLIVLWIVGLFSFHRQDARNPFREKANVPCFQDRADYYLTGHNGFAGLALSQLVWAFLTGYTEISILI
jgi:hypothetical protein